MELDLHDKPQESSPNSAATRAGQSRDDCPGSVSRLGKDNDRCKSRGDLDHCGEIEMDNTTWRESIATKQAPGKFLDDV